MISHLGIPIASNGAFMCPGNNETPRQWWRSRLCVFPTATVHVHCVRNLKVILRQRYISHQQDYWNHLLGVEQRFLVYWRSWMPQGIYLFSFVHSKQHLDRWWLIILYWVKLSGRSKLLPCGPLCSCASLVNNTSIQQSNSVTKIWPKLPKGSRIIRASWGVVHENFLTSHKMFSP